MKEGGLRFMVKEGRGIKVYGKRRKGGLRYMVRKGRGIKVYGKRRKGGLRLMDRERKGKGLRYIVFSIVYHK